MEINTGSQNEKIEMCSNKRARQNHSKNLNEVEISNLPDEEFKVMVINTWKRIEEQSENFNKELENIRKNQSELKNTITEIKTQQIR